MNVIDMDFDFRSTNGIKVASSLDNLFISDNYKHIGDLPSLKDNPRVLNYKNIKTGVRVDYSFTIFNPNTTNISVDVLDNYGSLKDREAEMNKIRKEVICRD